MTINTVESLNQIPRANELVIQSRAVTGGTLYITTVLSAGQEVIDTATSFAPSVVTPPALRYLALTNGKSDAGVPLTAAAGTPSGAVGVSRTAGTSLQLAGELTSGNAKTNKVMFEFNLPDTYVAGANIGVTVNANYSGGGSITAGSTTMTVAAYTEVNGVETALTVSAAALIPAAAGDLAFTITGTTLVPGQHMVLELVMLVTSASGGNTGFVNSVGFAA